MGFSDQTTSNLNTSAPFPQANERRARRPRSAGSILLVIVAFLAGIIVTFVGLLGYLFFANGNTQPVVSQTSSATDAIFVQTKTAYMTQVVKKNLNVAGLPGQITDAQVSFTHNGPMVITANLQLSILGISTTRQLSVALQPYVNNCELHMHVAQADLQGFPITVFVQSFESQINSQMQMKVTGLPPGFKYCVTNVQTDPAGLSLIYSATPI